MISRKVTREVVLTLRMLMNDKIMFDRYYCINRDFIHLWLEIQEIFPEGVANHVNKLMRMHEFVYKICKSRGKYFLYF